MPLGAHKAAIMGVAGVSTADVVLIQSQTADSDSEINFTSGIDSTYGEYIFRFYNINPATDGTTFQFQVSTDGGSSYGLTITASAFASYHTESNSATFLGYRTDADLAQATTYQTIMGDSLQGDADASGSGEMHLFNPSSTTYVKHFYSRTNFIFGADYAWNSYIGGYVNSTSDIDAVQFKMASGNFDGIIKLWGIP